MLVVVNGDLQTRYVVVAGMAWCLQAGDTSLLVACSSGHLAVARWLVEEKGVDYRAEKDNVSWKTWGLLCSLW